MKFCRWLSVLLLTLVPMSARAISLQWASGSTQMSFTEPTRCVLVVKADSTEGTLPAEWRLLWLADSSGVNFVAEGSSIACAADTARVSTVAPPATAADSAANMITTTFCSTGSSAAPFAYFVMDQPGGSCARFKVVALDPGDPDSLIVLESNEVESNGGISGESAPALLRANRSHDSSDLRVEAIGVGLSAASTFEIAAPDTSWRLALNVEARSDTRLAASARVAADMPPFVLSVGQPSGELGVASLPADAASLLSIQPACTNELKEINFLSHEDIQPKDFAIVASRDSFHVFYTRQDYRLHATPELDSKFIGHKRSRDLYNWDPDEHTMHSVQAGNGGTWDASHVWAPTIIKKPGDITYYMLYTGVDSNGVQRIGVATSTDLNVWTQDSGASYESGDVNWARSGTPEFRDPFVMADPDSAGRYLLYFVTKTQVRGRYVVGVARTDPLDPTNLRSWKYPQPLWNTDSLSSGAAYIESPHALKDPGNRWWLYYTGYNLVPDTTGLDSAFVTFQTNDVSPADLDSTRWSPPDTLYRFLGGDQKLQFWHASEYLSWAPGYEYLLAFNDSEHSVSISQMTWRSPHAFVLTDSCPPKTALAAPEPLQPVGVQFAVQGAVPGRAPLSFRLHVPPRQSVELAIFDVAGRRVRTLLDGEPSAADCEVRWDGLDVHGDLTGIGVYFARLSAPGGSRVAKLVLLR